MRNQILPSAFRKRLVLSLVFLLPWLNSWSALGSSLVDTVVADMQQPAEATLLMSPTMDWALGAAIAQGGVPRGDATPWWWNPSNKTYKSSAYWNAALPWFVIYPGSAHTAKNVRVKISAITLYTLSKSNGTWTKLGSGDGNPEWAGNYDFDMITQIKDAIPRVEPGGNLSYKLDANSHPIHGGLSSFAIPGSNVANVFAQVTSELILDNPMGVDDRSSAQLLVQMGVDYYPSTTTTVEDFAPMGYNPGAGLGRFSIVIPAPRNHYFVAIDPPGNLDNPHSPFQVAGGVVAISEASFRANPPPLFPPGGIPKNPPAAPTGLRIE